MLKVLTANIRRFPLLSFYIVLFTAPALSSNDYDDNSRRKEYLKLMRTYEEFEAQVNRELKQAFVMIDKFSEEEITDRDANASKIEDSEGYMAKLTELLGNVEMTLEALLPGKFFPCSYVHLNVGQLGRCVFRQNSCCGYEVSLLKAVPSLVPPS